MAQADAAERPNILFFCVDNLGFGELSCYSGGPFRGTWTRRIDAFAQQGYRLTNYAPEAQCTPSRSALLTGRYAIRSGTYSVPLGAPSGWGLVGWEKTLGDVLSEAGYACAAYGKWHVGEGSGRWPTDKGFEEWYGPPRTYDECLWPTDPWYDPERDPVSKMVEIKLGEEDVTEKEQLTLDVRRDCDVEYLRRASAFIRAKAERNQPFFLYFNHSMMHMPVIARKEFLGRTGQGEWADSLLELDEDFGSLLDLLDELELTENTLVVFAGDNGPEEVLLWRGTPGYWEGSYFSGSEGNLRTPCIARMARDDTHRSRLRRDHARHGLVHNLLARRRHRGAVGPPGRRPESASLAPRRGGVLATRWLHLLDGTGDVRCEVAKLQASSCLTEVLDRRSPKAFLPPHR
jgi:arylsulfatase A-like enzyme